MYEEDMCSCCDLSVEETKPTTGLGTTMKHLENKHKLHNNRWPG